MRVGHPRAVDPIDDEPTGARYALSKRRSRNDDAHGQQRPNHQSPGRLVPQQPARGDKAEERLEDHQPVLAQALVTVRRLDHRGEREGRDHQQRDRRCRDRRRRAESTKTGSSARRAEGADHLRAGPKRGEEDGQLDRANGQRPECERAKGERQPNRNRGQGRRGRDDGDDRTGRERDHGNRRRHLGGQGSAEPDQHCQAGHVADPYPVGSGNGG